MKNKQKNYILASILSGVALTATGLFFANEINKENFIKNIDSLNEREVPTNWTHGILSEPSSAVDVKDLFPGQDIFKYFKKDIYSQISYFDEETNVYTLTTVLETTDTFDLENITTVEDTHRRPTEPKIENKFVFFTGATSSLMGVRGNSTSWNYSTRRNLIKGYDSYDPDVAKSKTAYVTDKTDFKNSASNVGGEDLLSSSTGSKFSDLGISPEKGLVVQTTYNAEQRLNDVMKLFSYSSLLWHGIDNKFIGTNLKHYYDDFNDLSSSQQKIAEETYWYQNVQGAIAWTDIKLQLDVSTPEEISNLPHFGGVVYYWASDWQYIDPRKLLINIESNSSEEITNDIYDVSNIKFTITNDAQTVDYSGDSVDIEASEQVVEINRDGDGKSYINNEETNLFDHLITTTHDVAVNPDQSYIVKDSEIPIELSKESGLPWNLDSQERLVFWPKVDYKLSFETSILADDEAYNITGIKSEVITKSYIRNKTFDIQEPILKNATTLENFEVSEISETGTLLNSSMTFELDTQTNFETAQLPAAAPTLLEKVEVMDDEGIVYGTYTFNQDDFDTNTGLTKSPIELVVSDLPTETTGNLNLVATYGEETVPILDEDGEETGLFEKPKVLLSTQEVTTPSIQQVVVSDFVIDTNSFIWLDPTKGEIEGSFKVDGVGIEEETNEQGGILKNNFDLMTYSIKNDSTGELIIEDQNFDTSLVNSNDGTTTQTFKFEAPTNSTDLSYSLIVKTGAGETSWIKTTVTTPSPTVEFDQISLETNGWTVTAGDKVSTKLNGTIHSVTMEQSGESNGKLIATDLKSLSILGLGTTIDVALVDEGNGLYSFETDAIQLDHNQTFSPKFSIVYDELNSSDLLTGETMDIDVDGITTPEITPTTFENEELMHSNENYDVLDKTVTYTFDYAVDTVSESESIVNDNIVAEPIQSVESIILKDGSTEMATLNSGEFDYDANTGFVNAKFENVEFENTHSVSATIVVNYTKIDGTTATFNSTVTDSFVTFEPGKPTKPEITKFVNSELVKVDSDVNGEDKWSTIFTYEFDATSAEEQTASGDVLGATKVTAITITDSKGNEVARVDSPVATDEATGIYSGDIEIVNIEPNASETYTLNIESGVTDNATQGKNHIVIDAPTFGVDSIVGSDLVFNSFETSYSAIKFDLNVKDLETEYGYDAWTLDSAKIINAEGKEFVSKDYDSTTGDFTIIVNELKPSTESGPMEEQINNGGYQLVITDNDGNEIVNDITVSGDQINGVDPATPSNKPGELENIIQGVVIDGTSITTSGSFNYEVTIKEPTLFDEVEFKKGFKLVDENGNEVKSTPLERITKAEGELITYSATASGLSTGAHEIFAQYQVYDSIMESNIDVELEVGNSIEIPAVPKTKFPWWIIIVILLLLTIIGIAAFLAFVWFTRWVVTKSEAKGTKLIITTNKKYDKEFANIEGRTLSTDKGDKTWTAKANEKGFIEISINSMKIEDGEKIKELIFKAIDEDQKDIKLIATVANAMKTFSKKENGKAEAKKI